MRLVLFLFLLATATMAYATEPGQCAAERKRASALRNVLATVGETTAEYRAMMIKKIQDAEAAAANCERAVAERKRADEVAAKKSAADRFAVDEMKSQGNFVRLAWSAYECSYEKERDAVLANPFANAEQKEGLKRTEIMLTRIRNTMKRGKLAQSSCRADDVARLAFCISDSSANPACAQDEMTRMITAEKELIAALQLTPSDPPLTPAQQQAKAEQEDMTILSPQFDRAVPTR